VSLVNAAASTLRNVLTLAAELGVDLVLRASAARTCRRSGITRLRAAL